MNNYLKLTIALSTLTVGAMVFTMSALLSKKL